MHAKTSQKSIFSQNSIQLKSAYDFKVLGQYKNAIAVCYSIVDWKKNITVLELMGSCFEQLAKHNQALKIYLTIPRLKRSPKIAQSMEQCLKVLQKEKASKVIYSYERNGPITFFACYNEALRKGITVHAYQKAHMEYLQVKPIYIPHIEGLDLAVPLKK